MTSLIQNAITTVTSLSLYGSSTCTLLFICILCLICVTVTYVVHSDLERLYNCP